MNKITGVVLSGGNSTRMGTDKAFLDFKGKPLIQHSIDLLHSIFNEVVISANSPEYNRFGFRVIPDERRDCGPLGGLYSILKELENDWIMLISCDTPFINHDLIIRLAMHTGDCQCVVPVHKQGMEPLIALYHKNCLPLVKEYISSDKYKMHSLVEHLHTVSVDVSDLVQRFPCLFFNVNFQEDLKHRENGCY